MSEQMLSYCGIDCATCPAFIATQAQDFEKLTTLAGEWFEGATAFLDGSSINLNPPEKGPGINAPYLDHKIEPQWNPINGMLKVEVDPAEKIYGLYDPNKKYLGMFNEFRGGVNLIHLIFG